MAMFKTHPERPEPYRRFEKPTPAWFEDAKLGIFVHWGPYSVPAWAEPIGALGTIEKEYWYRHNPYAEWYYNTIRIADSPAAEHQRTEFGGAPYDDFLDAWTASRFDAAAVLELVAQTGARYFVPTTKHHDGVTLWDAPGTGERNTVRRGPHRDLIAEFGEAARARGVRFGVYYSGGLDWHYGGNPPITSDDQPDARPNDAAYAGYAYDHVVDLIDRYRPDLLWGDIEWPDAGKEPGPKSLVDLFEHFYAAAPDGVVNDRWGETHWDFRTSEYSNGLAVEGAGAWENCRGIGYSFGYNQLDDENSSLDGPAAIRHFVDVVSRGGNFLLNIGLMADGTVPELQRRTLEALGAWNAENGDGVFGSRPLASGIAAPSDSPWVRWTRTGDTAHAFIVVPGEGAGAQVSMTLAADPSRIDAGSARLADGTAVVARAEGGSIALTVPAGTSATPLRVTFAVR